MSQATTNAPIEAVVCIPTFRRPEHLEKTLESLVAQRTGLRFAVAVVENEAKLRQGEAVANRFFAERRLTGLCVVESRQGNCFAINRAFALGRETYPDARYFLMIDDDEFAFPSWLDEMLRAARETGADIVGGPVVRAFAANPDRGARLHPLFNTPPFATGFVPSLQGSGNCLIARHVFERLDPPEFDLRFNHLGGGDLDFFTRCRLAGFRAYWNGGAVVFETVPEQRMAISWMLRRSLTTGVINYTVDRKRYPHALGLVALWAKNFGALPLSLLRAARVYLDTRHWLPASFPVLMAIGRTLGALGFSPAPYKA